MFDYQAGEKYQMTLIMVGIAGVMAGMFFTFMLMPVPQPVHKKQAPRWSADPDVTGGGQRSIGSGAAQASSYASPSALDPQSAKAFIEEWLPLAWDLSAGTAAKSQAQAIQSMTPEVAAAYRQNVWTADIAKQIDAAGVKSSFQPIQILAGQPEPDGSVVVLVDGVQSLNVPGKGQSTRQVKLEYLLKLGREGIRIVGISEGGRKS